MTTTNPTRTAAFDLRASGRTYTDIARILGLRNSTAAYDAVEAHARATGQQVPGYNADRGRRVAEGIARSGRTRRQVPNYTPVDRRFGVEIECVATPNRGRDANCERAAQALRDAGLRAAYEGYNHRTPQGAWKVVYDVSVTGGVEVVSPPLSGADGFAEITTAVNALRAAGFRVDRSCGLHVHHEVSDLTGAEIGSLVSFYTGHQSALDSLVAPSRRSTVHAALLGPINAVEREGLVRRLSAITGDTAAEKITSARSLGFGDRPAARYRVLNVHSFGNYGTVEFRQHQGTLNARKIEAWVRLGQAVIEAARNADTVATGTFLADLTTAGRLPEATSEYLSARQDALA